MMKFPEEGLPGLKQTSSTAFTITNQNSAVCLPLLTDSHKLIWVHSHQIDMKLTGAAELEKAFDKFPYLTNRQTTALAQRCSLHPDQVKVWFMAQRLRYGISWDYKDVCQIRKKVMSSQENAHGEKELQSSTGREVKKRGRKKRQRCNVGETPRVANDGGVGGGGDVSAKEQKTKQPMEEKKGRKLGESFTTKKRRRIAEMDKTTQMTMKQDNESVTDSERLYTQPESEQPAHHVFTVPHTALDSLLVFKSQRQTFNPCSLAEPELLKKIEELFPHMNTCQLGGELKAEETNSTCVVSDTAKLEELTEGNNPPNAPAVVLQQPSPVAVNTLPSRMRCNTRSHTQLMMMKIAFSHCQYPDSAQYDRLAALIGVSRHSLVQWFADMRYMVKKRRPRWMTDEQYKQAVNNVKHQQYMNTLAAK